MTGLHPHQVGIFNWTGLLNDRCVTVFELLHRAGYATCAVGRLDMVTAENWHEPAMIARCVDRFLGSTGHTGPGNYFKDVRDTAFYRNGKPFTLPPEGTYKTDLITDFAVEFIRDTAAGGSSVLSLHGALRAALAAARQAGRRGEIPPAVPQSGVGRGADSPFPATDGTGSHDG